MRLLFCLCLLMFTDAVRAQSIPHYSGDVWVKPEVGFFEIELTIKVIHRDDTEFAFLLNPQANLLKILNGNQPVDYKFLVNEVSPNEFIDGKKLLLTLNKSQNPQFLKIIYNVPIKAINYWENEEEAKKTKGIEVGLYSAWLPQLEGFGTMSYNLNIHLPEEYGITGNGSITQVPAKNTSIWKLTNNGKQFDPTLLVGPTLQVENFNVGSGSLKIVHFGLDENVMKELSNDITTIKDNYSKAFGNLKASTNAFQFVFVPREDGPSYSRNGFAVITYGNSNSDTFKKSYYGTFKNIAHEIGHFWWIGAPYNSWEDWLNESFAEYASIMAVGEKYGSLARMKLLEKYKRKAKKLPAIWNVKRTDPQATSILYNKGPVLLEELRIKIGDKAFLNWLKYLNVNEVKSTEGLIQALEEMQGPKIAEQFQQMLSN